MQQFPDQPCDKCGSTEYIYSPGAGDEMSGYECADCGKGFIPDAIQRRVRFEDLPSATQEYLENLKD
jgi:rubredoxin